MRRNNKFINLVMGLIILGIAFSFVAVLTNTLANNEILYELDEVASEAVLKITEMQIKESGSNIDLELVIPVVEGLANSDVQASINSTLENDIKSFQMYMLNMAGEEYNNNNEKYVAKTSFKTNYKGENILSISVIFYQYTGGAHGIYDMVGYNFDLKKGTLIELNELLANESYKDIINEEIKRQISENEKNIDYFEDESGFKSIASQQPYYIKDDKLVIFFSLYEIAPYASGIPEFEIPLSLFGEDIKFEIT
mgnify:FL=1